MKFEKMKQCMQQFSIEQLKNYLGVSLVDSFIEWSSDNQPLFTRKRLIDMIITVHGLDILSSNQFRMDLISTLTKSDIDSLKLTDQEKSMPANEFASYLSEKPWKDCESNRKLLEILGITHDVFSKPKDDFIFIETISSNERFYELLDYQFVIKQKVLYELNRGIELNRLLVHMPTGTGKTKTAMHIITHYINFDLNKSGLIIWIAHTKELLMQAFETFTTVWHHLGNGSIKTYKLWGDNNDIENICELNGVMFCGIQKLMSIEKNNPDLFQLLQNECRLIIFDEAHKAAATGTKKTVNNLMIKKSDMEDRSLVGLTATPGRSTEDSLDNIDLRDMFGNKMISIDTKLMNELNMSKQKAINAPVATDIIKYFQDRKILAQIKKEELTYPNGLSNQELSQIKVTANSNGYNDFSLKALEIIGRNKYRNIAIMQKLRYLNANNIPTIVFACSVEHSKMLSAMLTLEDIPNALVIGEMHPTERADAIKAFKDRSNKTNIIINYEVLTTGFDSTNIKCVFIARPTQSVVLYSQMIGRGLRGPQMGGNEECLLIDVKDNLASYNENMAFSHFDNYWKG